MLLYRGVVSPSRDMFLVEFSTLEQSIFLINHVESHGFLIRFITPDLRYGPAQDLPRYNLYNPVIQLIY